MSKCNKRGVRRDLTDRYQDRQTMLRANYYGWEEARARRKYYRKQSSLSCGIARCNMCMNDRRNPWHSIAMRLTMAEKRANDSFRDQLEYYYEE